MRYPVDRGWPASGNLATTRQARLRHLAGLGATLPGLLEELRAATHILSGSERERAFWLLGEAYRAAWEVVYKLGHLDLASRNEDRYEWAAARCGDELAVLRGDYGRADHQRGLHGSPGLPGTFPGHDRGQTGACRRAHAADVGQPAPEIRAPVLGGLGRFSTFAAAANSLHVACRSSITTAPWAERTVCDGWRRMGDLPVWSSVFCQPLVSG
jgi:hypothetical protein